MVEQKLRDLGYRLPELEMPGFNYVPCSVHNGVAYLAGQVPKVDGEVQPAGKIGAEVGFEEAQEAARRCVLNGLAWLHHELGGLDRVARVLRIDTFLAVAPGFDRMSEVIDAASDLLLGVFGENGRHPRSVIGVSELPRNAPVLIELTVAVLKGQPS